MSIKSKIGLRLAAAACLAMLGHAAPALAQSCASCFMQCEADRDACWIECEVLSGQQKIRCRNQCRADYYTCGDACMVTCG